MFENMKITQKFDGDAGYERKILISIWIFTILLFVLIIATDGNGIAIGAIVAGFIIYMFILIDGRKGRVNQKQNRVVGVIHNETWISTVNGRSEFTIFGIKEEWPLNEISEEERRCVEDMVKLFGGKPQSKIIENTHLDSIKKAQYEKEVEEYLEKKVEEIDQQEQEEENKKKKKGAK